MRKNTRVIVIGGGPAGIGATISLAEMGIGVELIEAEKSLGGKLRLWHHLFPDRLASHDLLELLLSRLQNPYIQVHTSTMVEEIRKKETEWLVRTHGKEYLTEAVLLATGFDVFDAHLKEEYGYGIYQNVITSVDLEALFRSDKLVDQIGRMPQRIAFVHCVGSRDEKVGIHHCSRACCITGVKQAIEIREMLPACEVYNFYMDMRMFGGGYEELYREAQEMHNVTFIRGRVSEASENREGRVVVKAEDTLSGRPIKMTVDLLVLLVGMVPAARTSGISVEGGLTMGSDGFLLPEERFVGMNFGQQPGIFLAGTCTGPRSIPEAVSDGRSAAIEMLSYLKKKEIMISG